MAAKLAITSSSLGLTGTGLASVRTRGAKTVPTSLGLSSTVVRTLTRSGKATGSLGLTPSISMSAKREAITVGSNGFTPGPVSLGLTSVGNRASVVRFGVGQASLGLSGFATANINYAKGTAASLGLSAKVMPNFNRAPQARGSVGLSSATRVSKLHLLTSLTSLGLTSVKSPRLLYLRASGRGSLGLTPKVRPNYARRPKAGGSLGLSGSTGVSIKPAPSPGSISLIEVQDGAAPATYGSAQAREYQNLTGAATVSSYPKPFNLLN